MHLFEPFTVRSITFRNRIGVSPMCQYSSEDGFANDWHLVHLGAFARGGAGLVMMEATGVDPAGRITPYDHGLWSAEHVAFLQRITAFLHGQGAVAGIQIAHAGRKASRTRPWEGDADLPNTDGGWEVVGPSPIAFGEGYRTPHELSTTQIKETIGKFVATTRLALAAGFRVLEIHGAHGYLIHSFLSPLSNQRSDEYGGSFQNRIRFLLEIIEAVRAAWPAELPLWARLSCSDWTPSGWTIEDSVKLARELKQRGVDVIDCSSGGNVKAAKIPVGASYQVPFAEAIRRGAEIPTAAVGMITEPMQADDIVRNGRADIVLLARQMLRDPQWAFSAGRVLHQKQRLQIPPQYLRAID